MREEDLRAAIDLSFYRIERAQEDLQTAKDLYEVTNYRVANNRAYYAIFHALRAVMALEQFDSKKHSGIISEFQRKFIKNGIFPKEMSKMISSAFVIRNASDYDDMFIANKDETAKQIRDADFIISKVKEYLGGTVEAYAGLFDREGTDRNSQIINLLLVALFSSDALLTTNDCDRSGRELMKIKWALDETQLPEGQKAYWKEKAEQGIEICRRDRAEMEKKA